MINSENAINLLISFFDGRPPFAAVSEFVGHAASRIPDVFLEWFGRLEFEGQQIIVDTLCSQMLNENASRVPLPQAMALLVDIVSQYPTTLSQKSLGQLESYARGGDNLSRWLRNEELTDVDSGQYRDRWQFALALWNLLYLKKSPAAEELYTAALSRAKDEHFKRSIALAKRCLDNPKLR